MKRILLIIVGLILLFSAKAEVTPLYEYVPIVREGIEWVYYTEYSGHNEEFYHRFRFCGADEIEGEEYLKLYSYQTCNFNVDDAILVAYMRENNKKVYVRYTGNRPGNMDWVWFEDIPDCKEYSYEFLMYDFSLNAGDIAIWKEYDGTHTDEAYISGINLIEIDGKLRKLFTKYKQEKLHIIEGIGAIDCYTLLYDNQPTWAPDGHYGPELLYQKDLNTGEIIYASDKYTGEEAPCPDSVAKILSENYGISLSYETSDIAVNIPGKFTAVVFDTEGRNCGVYSGNDELRIPTVGMAAGVYILRVTKADGSTASAKFEVH